VTRLAWLVRRLTHAFGLILAVLVLNFLLVHLAPGDPADTIAGEMGGTSPQILAAIRARYGLDQPLGEQSLRYLGHVLRGDLGYSYYFNQSVTSLVLSRMGATALLVASAIVIALIVGTWLGVVAARRPRGIAAQLVAIFSMAGFAMPVFWSALMLLLLFASVLPWFPVSGMQNDVLPQRGMAYVLDVAHHLVLPAGTLAFIYIAQYSRQARAGMRQALGRPTMSVPRAPRACARCAWSTGMRCATRSSPSSQSPGCSSDRCWRARCWSRRSSHGPASGGSPMTRSCGATARRCSASCLRPR
jgi:peptide/nickel transport system permease protein